MGKAGRKQLDRLRREDERQREQHDLGREQERKDAVAEKFSRIGAALGANARIGGNECGIERTFGKDGAEMVRQPKGNEERIGHRPGAEERREHDVAGKAGEAGEQRKAANGENPLDHWRLDTTARSSRRKRDPRNQTQSYSAFPAGAGPSGTSFSPRARAEPPR